MDYFGSIAIVQCTFMPPRMQLFRTTGINVERWSRALLHEVCLTAKVEIAEGDHAQVRTRSFSNRTGSTIVIICLSAPLCIEVFRHLFWRPFLRFGKTQSLYFTSCLSSRTLACCYATPGTFSALLRRDSILTTHFGGNSFYLSAAPNLSFLIFFGKSVCITSRTVRSL